METSQDRIHIGRHRQEGSSPRDGGRAGLEREPSIPTVHDWLKNGREILNRYTADEVEAERDTLKAWVGAIVERFLPLAISDDLQVRREVMVDGQRSVIIDENAFKEQDKAANTVLKAIAQMGVLYGFEKPEKVGSINLTRLQLQVINHVNGERLIQIGGASIEGGGEVLELETGIDGL